MINSKVYGLIGLAMRAGKIAFGADSVEDLIKKRKLKLVNVAEDSSDFYLYTFQQAYVNNILSTRLSQKKAQIINTFKNKNADGKYEDFSTTYVKKYTDRYSEYLIEQ